MTYRRPRALILAAVAAVALSWHMHLGAQSGTPPCGVAMRVLVISADGNEVDLPAIQQALEYIGTPYVTYVATEHPEGLTADRLSTGCHGAYQGISSKRSAICSKSSKRSSKRGPPTKHAGRRIGRP
jgi:hypothetical protein